MLDIGYLFYVAVGGVYNLVSLVLYTKKKVYAKLCCIVNTVFGKRASIYIFWIAKLQRLVNNYVYVL